MVTTRSAEKHAKADGKTESLALRAKPDEGHSFLQPSDADISPLSSSKKKNRILVNVPPPRKRSRLSYEDVTDVTAHELDIDDSDSGKHDTQIGFSLSEIPDSQESPAKSNHSKQPKPSSHHVAFEDSTTTVNNGSATNEDPTKLATSQAIDNPSTSDSNKLTNAQVHPSKGPGRNEEQGRDEESPADDHDDSDAPEAATTKAPLSATPRVRRKPRAKRMTEKSVDGISVKSDAIKNQSSTQHVNHDEGNLSVPATAPLPRLDTEQDPHSTVTLDSDDSQDSAFVTARTVRHIDVFVTPQSTPLTRSPDLERPNGVTLNSTATKTLPQPSVLNSTLDPETHDMENPIYTSRNVSTSLPAKSGNSLERHRQQLLRQRADKNLATGRGSFFRMQDEWPSKRRKFVIDH